jgi:hypothetical protein
LFEHLHNFAESVRRPARYGELAGDGFAQIGDREAAGEAVEGGDVAYLAFADPAAADPLGQAPQFDRSGFYAERRPISTAHALLRDRCGLNRHSPDSLTVARDYTSYRRAAATNSIATDP